MKGIVGIFFHRYSRHGRIQRSIDNGGNPINDILDVIGTQDELEEGVSCPFEVTVTRTNNGFLDPALTKGGYITSTREATVVVNVIP